ncbi:MAG TPA: hypothetical protein VJZ00_19830, partial [Thermoanaerobaculia bacterium]|nr:hypothetical protein [Thermoanaerobaculia bacterium]
MKFISIVLVMAAALSAAAQTAPANAVQSIQDNGFLVEEAYNQDPGTLQHAAIFFHERTYDVWLLNFREEFAMKSQRHQGGFLIPLFRINGDTDLGDVTLNYRYQLKGDRNAAFAVAPRVSLTLPTAEGSDGIGVTVNVPFSRVFTPRVAAHSNVGGSWLSQNDVTALTLGQSVIFAVTPRLHLMLEGLWVHDSNDDENLTIINPALRMRFDVAGGKLVPGIGYAFR